MTFFQARLRYRRNMAEFPAFCIKGTEFFSANASDITAFVENEVLA